MADNGGNPFDDGLRAVASGLERLAEQAPANQTAIQRLTEAIGRQAASATGFPGGRLSGGGGAAGEFTLAAIAIQRERAQREQTAKAASPAGRSVAAPAPSQADYGTTFDPVTAERGQNASRFRETSRLIRLKSRHPAEEERSVATETLGNPAAGWRSRWSTEGTSRLGGPTPEELASSRRPAAPPPVPPASAGGGDGGGDGGETFAAGLAGGGGGAGGLTKFQKGFLTFEVVKQGVRAIEQATMPGRAFTGSGFAFQNQALTTGLQATSNFASSKGVNLLLAGDFKNFARSHLSQLAGNFANSGDGMFEDDHIPWQGGGLVGGAARFGESAVSTIGTGLANLFNLFGSGKEIGG